MEALKAKAEAETDTWVQEVIELYVELDAIPRRRINVKYTDGSHHWMYEGDPSNIWELVLGRSAIARRLRVCYYFTAEVCSPHRRMKLRSRHSTPGLHICLLA